MLSRFAGKSVKNGIQCLAVVRPSSTVAKTEEPPKEVTFEKRKRPILPGKVRMGFIPDEWFTMFYPKTGVTGPYAFGVSFLTYLYSKEILVMEHEFFSGISLAIILIVGIKKFGPAVAEAIDSDIDAIEKQYHDYRESNLGGIRNSIEDEERCQLEAKGQTILFDAKRENIGLQLEAAYRDRLAQVHSQVKKKLDYQLETSNVKTRMEQKHMVNWIVENVRKSITPGQESAALKQCLGDLKNLAKA